MPLILQPSASANARQRCEVQVAAYEKDVFMQSLCANITHEETVDLFWQLIPQNDGDRAWIKGWEIWDEEAGKVAAFAKWKYPHPQQKDAAGKEEPVFSFDNVVLPPGVNPKLFKAIMGPMVELGDKYADSSKYYLDSMCVDPAYQRRGLARQLLDVGLNDADAAGTRAYLLASDRGRVVYEKLGFGVVEEKWYDFTDVGATGARRSTVMLREVGGGKV